MISVVTGGSWVFDLVSLCLLGHMVISHRVCWNGFNVSKHSQIISMLTIPHSYIFKLPLAISDLKEASGEEVKRL